MEEKAVIGNIKTIESEGDFGLQSENSPFVESFYFEDYYDDRAVKKFVKTVERLIRTSREYNTYISELRNGVGILNHDNILSNISAADVDLEFHHYPFTLYDIIEIVMLHHMAAKEKFTSFSIAKEVMELHYKHVIGLVSLTKTNHELSHSGNLFISTTQVFGDYKAFVELYKDGISGAMLERLNVIEDLTKNGMKSDFKGLLQ